MSEVLTETARLYASRNNLRLAERAGFGIHSIVHVFEDNLIPIRH